MNARQDFRQGLAHVAPIVGVGADEKMQVADIASMHSVELAAHNRAEALISAAEHAADRLGHVGLFQRQEHVIGVLKAEIRSLCLECASELPPTTLDELTVEVDGDEFIARYSADETGDIEIQEVYSKANLWGLVLDPITSVAIEKEVARLHLKGLQEDAVEAMVDRGRAAMGVQS